MKFDFDKVTDRADTYSVKWNVGEGELPMWVADMDFKTAPAVIEAVTRRAQNGVYGYTYVPDEWYAAYIGHWERRHGFKMEKEWLSFTTGVIPAITSVVKRLTNHGDNVILQTPVYNIFYNCVENSGRHVLENPLKFDGKSYSMDFADLEEKLKHPYTTLMILCNPHNPVGCVWDKNTLAKVGELCDKYGVKVVSDEIHCDITEPDVNYVPFASVDETCKNISVTTVSVTKAFNLASMQSAAVSVPSENIRRVVFRGLNSDEVAEAGAFAVEAAVAALEKGDEWLDALREYVSKNRSFLTEYLKKELPEVNVIKQNATYLVWADVSAFTDDSKALCDHIRKTTGLFITAGSVYHGNGNKFVRINIACPRSVLADGLTRFVDGIKSYAIVCRGK